MRTIPAITDPVLDEPIVKVGYLVELHFSTPLYLCSWGSTRWNSIDWVHSDIVVSALRTSAQGIQTLSLTIGNRHNQISALILNEGINDKLIKVYKIYFDSNDNPLDPIALFKGYGDGADLTAITSIKIKAVASSAKTIFSTRRRINEQGGFHYVPAPGTRFHWGNTTVTLE